MGEGGGHVFGHECACTDAVCLPVDDTRSQRRRSRASRGLRRAQKTLRTTFVVACLSFLLGFTLRQNTDDKDKQAPYHHASIFKLFVNKKQKQTMSRFHWELYDNTLQLYTTVMFVCTQEASYFVLFLRYFLFYF